MELDVRKEEELNVRSGEKRQKVEWDVTIKKGELQKELLLMSRQHYSHYCCKVASLHSAAVLKIQMENPRQLLPPGALCEQERGKLALLFKGNFRRMSNYYLFSQ